MSQFLSAEPVYAFTFLLTLIVLGIYTIFVLTGRMFDEREKRIALLCAVTVGFLSTAEFTGAYLDFAGGAWQVLHTVVKFLELSLTPGLLFAMGMSMNVHCRIRWAALPIAASVALQAVMLPFRLVFYVDEASLYHHGPCYWVYLVLIIISAVYLCCVFFVQARKLQSRHSFYCVLSVLLPLTCFLAHIFVPEINMSWLGVSIAIIFMYSAHCSVKLCTDHITQLLDRSSFDADLQSMKKGSTLIFFDINKFKQLNDNHGHIVGDEYLSVIARFIREAYEDVGRCYRIGGDEFAVIVYRKNVDVGKANETFLSLLDNGRKRDPLLPRISIGSCTYTGEGQSKNDVFNTADMRMYSNKAEGSSGVD